MKEIKDLTTDDFVTESEGMSCCEGCYFTDIEGLASCLSVELAYDLDGKYGNCGRFNHIYKLKDNGTSDD